MRCDDFREMLDAYLMERLEGEERRQVRDHLQTCPRCRDVALEKEPTLLFAATPPQAPDDRGVEVCVTAVTASIRQERLDRRLRSRRRPWLAAAAAIAVLVGGGLIWWSMPAVEGPVSASVEETTGGQGKAPPPQVEVDMKGEDVRTYTYASDEDDDTAVLFIVNPAMEL